MPFRRSPLRPWCIRSAREGEPIASGARIRGCRAPQRSTVTMQGLPTASQNSSATSRQQPGLRLVLVGVVWLLAAFAQSVHELSDLHLDGHGDCVACVALERVDDAPPPPALLVPAPSRATLLPAGPAEGHRPVAGRLWYHAPPVRGPPRSARRAA